jgi:hypothetical protein
MKRPRNRLVGNLAAIALLTSTALSGVLQPDVRVPELFYSSLQERPFPIWISAELARTSDDRVDWKLFSPVEQDSLRRTLAVQDKVRSQEPGVKHLSPSQRSGQDQVHDENCTIFQQPFYHFSEEAQEPGLTGLVKASHGIFSASITGISQGFFLGNPASVLRIDISEAWKTTAKLDPTGEIFLVIPFARFAIDDKAFCTGTPESSFRPQIGQRVTVFVTALPLDKDSSLLYADPNSIIAEQSDKTLFIPPGLKDDEELFPAKTLGELEEILRRVTRRTDRLTEPSRRERDSRQ